MREARRPRHSVSGMEWRGKRTWRQDECKQKARGNLAIVDSMSVLEAFRRRGACRMRNYPRDAVIPILRGSSRRGPWGNTDEISDFDRLTYRDISIYYGIDGWVERWIARHAKALELWRLLEKKDTGIDDHANHFAKAAS